MTVNSVEERILAAARYKLNMDEKVIQAGMFDMKSSGTERKQFLESILQQDEAEEEENEVPDDETVNQMIARSESEFQKFQQMDQERVREEERSRLVGEDELPEWVKWEEREEEEGEDDDDEEGGEEGSGGGGSGKGKGYGRGNRQKKDVDYTDNLTEKEWLKVIGAMDEEGGEKGEEDGLGKRRRGDKKKEADGTKRNKGKEEKEDGKDKEKMLEKVKKQMKRLMDCVINYKDW